MKWSWRVGRLAGIAIHIHATFLILLAWIALLNYQQGGTLWAMAEGVLLISLVFGIVVLHELGHALAARRYGIGTRDITLLPIGGVARLESMPEEPGPELVIAIAGPAVNVALAAICYLLIRLTGGSVGAADLVMPAGSWLSTLFTVNVTLALFNLIPAFPMDGGRVLRAMLSFRKGRVRATEIAARVGQAFALVFGLIGIFTQNPFLVFIALFVWLGAAGEAASVQTTSSLAGLPVAQVMITDIRTLGPDAPLTAAVEHVLGGFQQDFPVVADDRIVGVLTRTDLLAALSRNGLRGTVGEVMRRDFESARPDEELDAALTRLRSCNCRTMPVVRGRELVGVLTLENVGEYVMVQSALQKRKS